VSTVGGVGGVESLCRDSKTDDSDESKEEKVLHCDEFLKERGVWGAWKKEI